MPVSFVSAGLRKTEAEEKQQQKGEEDANDSEDDAPPAPSPPRSTAPKKLQMVNFLMYEFQPFAVYSATEHYMDNYINYQNVLLLADQFPQEHPGPEVCRRRSLWTRHW